MSDIIIMVSIVVYLLVVVAIGIQYSKKNKSSDDFYLGGRKLGPFVTAMSAEASDMSSWLLMGLPGVAYLTGVADAAWTAIGLAIGTYINWLIVAKRIRMYSQGYDAFTVPDFFSKRFGGCKTLSCIAAIMIVVFFVPYTASGFAACGKLFSSLFGVSYLSAMVISAAVIVCYCTLGGFLAAMYNRPYSEHCYVCSTYCCCCFRYKCCRRIDAVVDNAKQLPGAILDYLKHIQPRQVQHPITVS